MPHPKCKLMSTKFAGSVRRYYLKRTCVCSWYTSFHAVFLVPLCFKTLTKVIPLHHSVSFKLYCLKSRFFEKCTYFGRFLSQKCPFGFMVVFQYFIIHSSRLYIHFSKSMYQRPTSGGNLKYVQYHRLSIRNAS